MTTTAVPMRTQTGSKPRSRSRWCYETKITWLALGAGFPGGVVGLILLWTWDARLSTQVALSLVIVLGWLGFALALRERVKTTLMTTANLLTALREGDFSLRAHGATRNDALGDVNFEINLLGDTLREQRRTALEATALLRKVMDEIEVVVLAFDAERKLRLANRRGERLLGKPHETLIGMTADEIGVGDCLDGETSRIVELTFPGGSGRWEIRRGTYREHGEPRQLVVLSDLTRTLREEERQAWQRLIQVLRHEINNSLAPICSLADSLRSLLVSASKPDEWEEDMSQGLAVITDRSESLNRFMASYTKVTRLPEPDLQPVEIARCIERVVGLEKRLPVRITPGPPTEVLADRDQLELLLINLMKNAVEAALETEGGVCITWTVTSFAASAILEVTIVDEGPGILSPENLFVPFFTTKPTGTGLGLMLSRQIAEGHRGNLTLVNRTDRTGCSAILRLPI